MTSPSCPRSPHRFSTLQRLALLGALLAGFALRLYRLGAESLWYDETVSVFLAQKSAPDLISHTAGDIHPPGYYLLLHAWRLAARPTVEFGLEFLYAWPSLCAGLLLLALLVPVSRQLFGARWAQISGWIATVGVWLGAINPFHIWYAQEVRMYTVGGALGLLCFWAMWRALQPPPNLFPGGGGADDSSVKSKVAQHGPEEPSPPTNQQPPPPVGEGWGGIKPHLPYLLVYALAAAAGLYVLYYFAFLLIALNALAFFLGRWTMDDGRFFGSRRNSANRQSPIANRLAWLAAQFLVLLLFLPWLPTLWRQATDPPVPPWREPWTSPRGLLDAIAESFAAPLIGQSAPFAQAWPWAVAVVVLIAYCLWAQTTLRGRNKINGTRHTPHAPLLTYFLLPTALVYALTIFGPPLYHVRYLFVFAAPLVLLFAWALVTLWFRARWLSVLIAAVILLGSGASLARFWHDPLLRADDHRSAVAELAARWRPGDAILVNAGWAYTALDVYWPTKLVGPRAVVPPSLRAAPRLLDYVDGVPADVALPNDVLDARPIIIRTGSVDGPPSLGWGNPASDFFAISSQQTVEALGHVGKEYQRIWHYRIYDTVNDPNGLIRSWLSNHSVQRDAKTYAGDSFLNVQLHNHQIDLSHDEPSVEFSHDTATLALVSARYPGQVAAGNVLYIDSYWSTPGQSPPLAVSLRLLDINGEPYVQWDEPLDLDGAGEFQQPLALPVPIASVPGTHELELVVYEQATNRVLAPSTGAVAGERWSLGQVELAPSPRAPIITRTLARFDYIDLLSADLGSSASNSVTRSPGEALDLLLLWRPRPSDYRDTYDGVLELRNGAGQAVQSWRGPLGSEAYPSGAWAAGNPMRDVRWLPLNETLAAGSYTLHLRVERRSDGRAISARVGWLGRQPTLEIGRVVVE